MTIKEEMKKEMSETFRCGHAFTVATKSAGNEAYSGGLNINSDETWEADRLPADNFHVTQIALTESPGAQACLEIQQATSPRVIERRTICSDGSGATIGDVAVVPSSSTSIRAVCVPYNESRVDGSPPAPLAAPALPSVSAPSSHSLPDAFAPPSSAADAEPVVLLQHVEQARLEYAKAEERAIVAKSILATATHTWTETQRKDEEARSVASEKKMKLLSDDRKHTTRELVRIVAFAILAQLVIVVVVAFLMRKVGKKQ